MMTHIEGYGICTDNEKDKFTKHGLKYLLTFVKNRPIYNPDWKGEYFHEKVGMFRQMCEEIIDSMDDDNKYFGSRIAAIIIREYVAQAFPQHEIQVWEDEKNKHYVLAMPARFWDMSETARGKSAENFDTVFNGVLEDLLEIEAYTLSDVQKVVGEQIFSDKEMVRAHGYIKLKAERDRKVS